MNHDLNHHDARAWLEHHRAQLVGWRRQLHANPEIAFQEERTSAFVADKLQAWGLEVHRGLARTGVVATLTGGEGPAIGLRADMDALPMQEANTFAHRSVHAGQMHACGHDGHTVMLLAAAGFLAEHSTAKHALRGTVHFIFQPAEENEGGARVMVEDGLFERFPVHSVYGMHNRPGLDVGRFMVRSGPVSAGFDTFDFTIGAGGGHGAFPASGGDAVAAAAALIMQLQTIVSRQIAATESATLAVTQVHGGSAYNVLPNEIRVSGSVRWFKPEVQAEIRRRMSQQGQGVAASYGVSVVLDYQARYPSVINLDGPATLATRAARDVAGHSAVITEFAPLMGSEDFAFLLEKLPGAYLLTGNGPGEGGCQLHNPHYDFNDDAISHGAMFWIALCRRFFEDFALDRDLSVC
jgi:amidohydrolase